MDVKTLTTKLMQQLVTKNDVTVLLELITSVKELLFTKNMTNEIEKLKAKTPERFFSALESILTANETTVKMEKNLVELEKNLQSIPVAEITLSYEPTRKQIEELAFKIQNKIKKDIIINYKIKQEAVLGVQIGFQGKMYSKTLENLIKS